MAVINAVTRSFLGPVPDGSITSLSDRYSLAFLYPFVASLNPTETLALMSLYVRKNVYNRFLTDYSALEKKVAQLGNRLRQAETLITRLKSGGR